MSSKGLVGILLYAVAAFLLGWGIYGVALMDFMRSTTTMYTGLEKNPPDMLMLFLSNIAWGGLAYQVVNSMKALSFMDAMKKTMPIVFCVMAGIDLSYMAFFNLYSWTWIIVDMIVGTLLWSTCNGVMGWWLGRGSNNA